MVPIFLRKSRQLKKGKTTGKERFTVLWMSTRGQSRKLAFSLRTLLAAFCLCLFGVGAATYFIATYRANSEELAELRYMKSVAESQRQRISDLENQFQLMSERLRQAEIVENNVTEALSKEGIVPQSFAGAAVVAFLDRVNEPLPSRAGSRRTNIKAEDLAKDILVLEEVSSRLDDVLLFLENRTKIIEKEAEDAISYARAKPKGMPVSGPISSRFGRRVHPITGANDFHEAVDIAASYNSRIKAAADGTVTFSGYKSGFGYMITLKHAYGFETSYAHCCKTAVSSGDFVQRGDVIGYVGQSGSATGPHLHYSVYANGRAVDPAGYFE